MIGHDVARLAKPEGRQLCQHLAFVGNARAEHVVEGRNAIGRDDQERRRVFRERVDVANFPLVMTGEAVKGCFEYEGRRRQLEILGESRKAKEGKRESYRGCHGVASPPARSIRPCNLAACSRDAGSRGERYHY